MNNKPYEVTQVQIDIKEDIINIDGKRGSIGYFDNLDEAKNAMARHKQQCANQTYPYLIIHHDQTNNKRTLEHIEYPSYKLEKKEI